MRLEHDWLPFDLPDNVELGTGVFLYSTFAFRHYRSDRPCGVRVGHDSAIYEASMFDLGPAGEVELGDYCLVNSTHFVANSRIEIGSYTYLSSEVYLCDSTAPVTPNDAAYAVEPSPDAPSIVIGADSWVGMRSVVLRGTRLGRGVIVGAGSVVACEAPDYSIVAGNPARVVGSARPGEGPQGQQHDWWKD